MSLNFALGMTATAAASHGHEYSSSRDLNANQASTQHHHHHSTTLPHLSIGTPDLSLSSLWTPISYLGSKLTAWSPFGPPPQDTKSPTEPPVHHDNESINASETLSVSATDPKKERKRNMPSYTHFSIAHPPPESKRKRRPKVLLQLRLISEQRSAEPAFEMLPALHFVSLVKRLPLVFRHKFAPEFDDVVVLQSPNQSPLHSTQSTSTLRKASSETTDLDPANVVAVIHFQPKGLDGCMAQFQMSDGSLWSAYSVPRKGYEFKFVDKHGCESRARWWIKKGRSDANASGSGHLGANANGTEKEEQLFKFSIMSPSARRHPVIGSLQKSGERQKISIAEHYTVPDEWSASSPLATPSTTGLSDVSLSTATAPVPSAATAKTSSTAAATATAPPRQAFLGGTTSKYNKSQTMPPGTIVMTDDAMKSLMLVSGMWVTFAEGWSELHPSSTNANEPGTPGKSRGDLTKLNTRRHSLGATLIRRSASAAGRASEESDELENDTNASEKGEVQRSNSHSLTARWRRRKSAVPTLASRKASEMSVAHSVLSTGSVLSTYDVESPSLQSELGEASPEIIVSPSPAVAEGVMLRDGKSAVSLGQSMVSEKDDPSVTDRSVSVRSGSASGVSAKRDGMGEGGWEDRQREWGRSRRLGRLLGRLRGREEKDIGSR